MKNLFLQKYSPEWKVESERGFIKWKILTLKICHEKILFHPFSPTTEREKKRFNFCFDWNWTKIKWNHLKLLFKNEARKKKKTKKNHRKNFLQHENEHIFIALLYILEINWRFSLKIAALYSTYFVYHSIHHDILHTYERVKKGFNIEKWYECLMWSSSHFSLFLAHVTTEKFQMDSINTTNFMFFQINLSSVFGIKWNFVATPTIIWKCWNTSRTFVAAKNWIKILRKESTPKPITDFLFSCRHSYFCSIILCTNNINSFATGQGCDSKGFLLK